MTELLEQEEMTGLELSQAVGIREREVCEHLEHIDRSLRARGGSLQVRPSRCLHCGFTFTKRRRFKRPGRCPRCRASHISMPTYRISGKGR